MSQVAKASSACQEKNIPHGVQGILAIAKLQNKTLMSLRVANTSICVSSS